MARRPRKRFATSSDGLHCHCPPRSYPSQSCHRRPSSATRMSELTTALLGSRGRRRPSKWESRFSDISAKLGQTYGHPRLGNYRDPIKEVFYILLSARTSEALYMRAHRNLFRHYPSVDAIAKARIRDVRQHIHVAGLGTKRAIQVVQTARRLVADFGTGMRRKLRTMPPDEMYAYLVSLPGIGPKSALCVMMYSLDVDVFPVDANIRRIVERLGAIRKGYSHRQAQKAIPRLVPAGGSRNLHVGLVVHGRRTCLPRNPRCDTCMLRDVCRTGLRKAGRALTNRHNSVSAKVG